MEPSKRSRTVCALKWASTLLACLILAAFVFSTRRSVMWDSPSLWYEVSLTLGAIDIGWRPEGWRLENEQYPPHAGWSYSGYADDYALCWWIRSGGNRSWKGVTIPLWIPFALLAGPTASLWYLDRRRTRTTLSRLRAWLCPSRRGRMRLWLVALFGVIHAITSFLAWIAIVEHVYPFFVRNRGTDPVLEAIEEGLVWFFLTTPLWGILWAWLWVRFRNHLFDTQPGPHCRECGYDLTGNVSGICPECGKATASSA